jgi:hypothetical protein
MPSDEKGSTIINGLPERQLTISEVETLDADLGGEKSAVPFSMTFDEELSTQFVTTLGLYLEDDSIHLLGFNSKKESWERIKKWETTENYSQEESNRIIEEWAEDALPNRVENHSTEI